MCCDVTQQAVDELVSQMAYKDSRIIELDSEIQQLNQTIMDLREIVSEKNEVIRARDEAVQILRATQAENEADVNRDVTTAVNVPDSGAVLQLETQLLEANELIVAREKSLELLTKELNSRNQHIEELTSHLTLFQNSYGALQVSCTDLEQARDAALRNCAELETKFAAVEKNYNDLLGGQNGLRENSAVLEQRYADTQASHAELSQRYIALEESHSILQDKHSALESSFMQLQVEHLELVQADRAVVKSDSAVQTDDEPRNDELSSQRESEEELRDRLADCESKFSKFKSLAGSKIKALEKDLAALQEVCYTTHLSSLLSCR